MTELLNEIVEPVFSVSARGTKRGALLPAGHSIGFTVQSAAERLGVSRQRVYQLIREKVLAGFVLKDDAGNHAASFITAPSIDAYVATGRQPGRKPRQKVIASQAIAKIVNAEKPILKSKVKSSRSNSR